MTRSRKKNKRRQEREDWILASEEAPFKWQYRHSPILHELIQKGVEGKKKSPGFSKSLRETFTWKGIKGGRRSRRRGRKKRGRSRRSTRGGMSYACQFKRRSLMKVAKKNARIANRPNSAKARFDREWHKTSCYKNLIAKANENDAKRAKKKTNNKTKKKAKKKTWGSWGAHHMKRAKRMVRKTRKTATKALKKKLGLGPYVRPTEAEAAAALKEYYSPTNKRKHACEDECDKIKSGLYPGVSNISKRACWMNCRRKNYQNKLAGMFR